MPNFLGSAASFSSEFAKPIMKGQENGASSMVVVEGLEKLKILHQQVLPFILRREKSEVLKELPPKIVSYVTVPMSDTQVQLYRKLCLNATVQTSLRRLDELLMPFEMAPTATVDGHTLKSLMLLRLLCTHPSHLSSLSISSSSEMNSLSLSGKMMALVELLRNAGLDNGCVTAADNDSSLLYCDDASEETMEAFDSVVTATQDSGLVPEEIKLVEAEEKKCIIFAQFTKSLDLVESLILKHLMPHLRYLRLDGRVPAERRAGLAARFNTDSSVRILLSTTRVGGLGLNLTGEFRSESYRPARGC
jgi:TATA-binding protein-associated factor